MDIEFFVVSADNNYYIIFDKYIAVFLFAVAIADIYQLGTAAGLAGANIYSNIQLLAELDNPPEKTINNRYPESSVIELDKPTP